MISIRKKFSHKLIVGIMILAMIIFMVSLGILFTQSRHLIRVEALGRASSVLNTTLQRISRNLMTIENATNTYSWMAERAFEPDSILELTNRIVRLNPHIDGCSISAEPDLFPKYGRQYSAYTIREGDSLLTVVEEPYDYFHKVWYKTPRERDEGCWAVYFDDSDSLEVVLDGMLASYGKPLRKRDGSVLGIISTDLSLLRLSNIISEVRPYPNSYFIMIDGDGRYMIHPDESQLFYKTIFTDIDPRRQPDIIALGHEMTAGNQGRMAVKIDGEDCLVSYQPVPGTDWSLAIVCPDHDVLAGYNKLTYIIGPLLFIGLIIILVLCNRVVSHAISPSTDCWRRRRASRQATWRYTSAPRHAKTPSGNCRTALPACWRRSTSTWAACAISVSRPRSATKSWRKPRDWWRKPTNRRRPSYRTCRTRYVRR